MDAESSSLEPELGCSNCCQDLIDMQNRNLGVILISCYVGISTWQLASVVLQANETLEYAGTWKSLHFVVSWWK